MILFLLCSLETISHSKVPEFAVGDDGVRIVGVDSTNPVIYDNDWWFDVFDNNYLWAQASLGKVNLRGNIVSRDMWNWKNGYQYLMQQSLDDGAKALHLARKSGLRNLPDLTSGSAEALERPPSGRILDTISTSTEGSRLIVKEAKLATAQRPLVVVAGGPQTTVANALLTHPEIADKLIVFNLTVSGGYNGKDGWAAYIVAKLTRSVDWGGGEFWDKDSVFTAKHFDNLPKNPFTTDMQRFIRTDLGRANQLGDGAPLVWLFQPKCWTDVVVRKAEFSKPYLRYSAPQSGEEGDVLVVPKSATNLQACRQEFFRVLGDPALFAK